MKNLSIISALMLAGCVTAADAPLRSQAVAITIIAANKSTLFKDPDSVRDASVGTPFPGFFGSTRVCLRANAKNSFGGYTGLMNNMIIIRQDGTVASTGEPSIYTNCGDFIPAPELNGPKP